jgi:polyvinyl alcohol dehydrogenase (cytochrome)
MAMPCIWTNKNLGSLLALAAFGLSAGCGGGEMTDTVGAAQPAGTTPSSNVAVPPTTAGDPNQGKPATPGMTTEGMTAAPMATPAVPGGMVPTQAMPPAGGAPPAAAPASHNWLSYGNGYKNQFYNAAETTISVETAPMLKEIWTVAMGEVTAAPVVVDDKVYAGSSTGLLALNAGDGSVIWTAPVRSTSGPYYDEETKTLFSSASSGTINAVDAESGMVKWTNPISMQAGTNGWSSPIVSGNLVVVGAGSIDMGNYKGALSAFDKMTGEKAFEYVHCTSNGASIWSGPGADDEGILYATTGNNYVQTDDRSDAIFALDPAKPEMFLWNNQRWENDGWTFSGGTGPDHDFGANPIIVNIGERKVVAAGQKSGVFHVLDRATGEEVWQTALSQRTSAASGGILNNGAWDGKNFIAAANEGTAPGKVASMNAETGEIIWEKPMTGLSWAPISAANGVCFVPDNTRLWILDCSNGNELGAIMTSGTIGSAPSISNGKVFFGSGFNYSLGSVAPGRNLIALGL